MKILIPRVGDYVKVMTKSSERCGIVYSILLDSAGCTYYQDNDAMFLTHFESITKIYTPEENPEYFI